jgi:hypothetical protein
MSCQRLCLVLVYLVILLTFVTLVTSITPNMVPKDQIHKLAHDVHNEVNNVAKIKIGKKKESKGKFLTHMTMD